jgi:LemA protein
MRIRCLSIRLPPPSWPVPSIRVNYEPVTLSLSLSELQRDLVNTEDRIQAARRFYNGNVRDYRNKRETFPSSLVAGMFGFPPADFFSVPPAVQEVPDVDFG